MSHETSVKKYGGTVRIDVQLHGRPRSRHGSSKSLLHRDLHNPLFSRLKGNSLSEILVTVLMDRDHVLARKKQHLLGAFELFEVAHVLAIDPDTGGLFDFRFAFKLDFTHHLITGVDGSGKQESADGDSCPQRARESSE